MIPYTGALRPVVTELAPGHARVALTDRRGVRNHLRSIHAIALANLGELASGLALTVALPSGLRGIVTTIDVAYHKKARGRLVAESDCAAPATDAEGETPVVAHIHDAEGDEVATFTAHWLIGPEPGASSASRTTSASERSS